MKPLTVRVSDAEYAWLQAEAARAGVSINSVLRAALNAVASRGWQVEPQPAARVSDDGRL